MATEHFAAVPHRRGRFARFLAPLALAALIAAVFYVVKHPTEIGASSTSVKGAKVHRKIPPYYIVHSGDTLTLIANRNGLTAAQLQAYNPNADPHALVPGERLNLWAHPPQPRHKPPGPKFWTVKPGDSFGLIAAKTRISIATLFALNPQIKPSTIQPGDRIRLRR